MTQAITPLSARAAAMEPFRVMQILAEAQALEKGGTDVIHLEVGEPDFATPDAVVAAGRRALATGVTRYTAAHGTAALRAAIADDYRRLHGLDIDPERVIVTAGASAAILLALAAATDVGGGVLLPDPGYACNRQFVTTLGAHPVPVAVSPESGFQPTAEQIDAAWTPGVRAVMLASPANPTGTLLPPSELAAIGKIVRDRGGVLIMDEIYGRLVFGRAPDTALRLVSGAIIVNSFSKYYAMTGWRLGWLVVPEPWIEPVRRLAQNLFVAPSTVAQAAALAAFETDTESLLLARVNELQDRRDFLLSALPELGFQVRARPEGAFYIYADSRALDPDSEALCARILRDAGVALTPGTDFSPISGRNHIRIAYTQPRERLEEAVARLRCLLTVP